MDVVSRGRHYLHLADTDLISLAESDPEAFATLYDRHSRVAYALAYRMMDERMAAEDLVQEVFLKIWRAARSYRSERGSVRTWILSIVRNRGIDQLRSQASRRRTQEKIEASAPRSQPSEALTETWRNSRRDQVREALEALPPEQSKILDLAYFSGCTHVEIAGLLNIPLGTVKGRMRLGIEKMRGLLLMEAALLTPPVGMNLFVVQGIRERGNLNDVIVGTAPFILTLFLMIGLIIAVPGIVMWLPNFVE